MNNKQADAEAKRRWGPNGTVQWMKNGYKAVGRVFLGMAFSVQGSSHSTWEDAFADADSKVAKFDARKVAREEQGAA